MGKVVVLEGTPWVAQLRSTKKVRSRPTQPIPGRTECEQSKFALDKLCSCRLPTQSRAFQDSSLCRLRERGSVFPALATWVSEVQGPSEGINTHPRHPQSPSQQNHTLYTPELETKVNSEDGDRGLQSHHAR